MADADFINDLNAALAQIVQKVRQGLVQVGNGHGGQGAGTIWHPDGLILTNAHVVGNHSSMDVVLHDGRSLRGQVIARDEQIDLAALAVNADHLPIIDPGDSRRIKPGEWVIAIGHPWGVRNAITAGMVIGKTGDEFHELQQMGLGRGRDWLVAGLHMRPGHSGGAMVDVNGKLVGINTMMNGPDVGVAVPTHVAKAFLKNTVGLLEIPRPQPDSEPKTHYV